MTQLISQEDGRLGFRPWNELTVAALILLHMSWVVPWFFLIAGASVSQPEARVFLTLCLVEASLYLLVRLGILLRLKLRIRQGVFLVGLGLCWLASWLAPWLR